MKETGFADTNDTRLYYEVAGKGEPVVLVHGFSLDTRMWDEQFIELAKQYRVIRYDVRGYGRSDVPREGEPYYHADDLLGLLDHTGTDKAHIIGLSLGAAIACEFVVAHPERALSLVAADPVVWGYEWSLEYQASLGALWGAGKAGGIAAANALWLKHDMFAAAMQNEHVAEKLTAIIGDYSGWHWVNDDPGKLPEKPAFERLEEFRLPVLAIVGERDVADFHRITTEMRERIPGARKVVLPNVGHMSNMEDPARFTDTVLEFLAEVAAREAGPADDSSHS